MGYSNTSRFHEDAAHELIGYLAHRKETSAAISAHFGWTKSKLEAAQRIGINMGCLGFVRDGVTVLWCWKDEADRYRAKRKAEKQAHARQLAKRSHKPPKIDIDNMPDMPVIRRIIPAAMAKPVATNAARWVFEVAA